MIKPTAKIGIVYSEKSRKYANELKDIIMQRREEGFCIDVMMVDGEIIDRERRIDARVFNNLNKCDYSIVFLTKDISINDENYQFVSKPNVLLELGYFKGHIDNNDIWCITDFEYMETKDQYMMPSDIPGEVLEKIDRNNSYSDLNKKLNKFIETKHIPKMENYNANDLVGSLIKNSCYKTNYFALFSENQLKAIEKYSVKWQSEEIINIWIEEKTKLSEVEQILYIFERIVMLPFFSDQLISKNLDNFLNIEVNEKNEKSKYVSVCKKILKNINSYEMYKRDMKAADYVFCLEIAKSIEKELEIFKNGEVSPIIECVSRDYIGLGYLNAYSALCNLKSKEKDIDDEFKKNLLLQSKNNFERVLHLSEEELGDSTGIFSGFVYYNLARTNKNLAQNASFYFKQGINKRAALSRSNCFPEVFRMNFTLERVHAEIDYYDYLKESYSLKDYTDKIILLKEELEEMKKTPVAEVALFRRIEDKLNYRYGSSSR